MKTVRVLGNRTCNQNCTFCNARSSTDDRTFISRPAVEQRLQQAVAEGATELVLTGGEPTLRRDLPALVRRARELGPVHVALETNATTLTLESAGELVAAGVGLVRVHVPIWGPALDELTRDPGGFVALQAGLRALARTGVAIEVAIPIVRRNLVAAAHVPAGLAAEGFPISAIVLGVPVEGPDESELATLAEAAHAVATIDSAARKLGFAVRMDQGSLIPPCVLPRPDRVAHLYSMNRGGAERAGYARVAECEPCALVDRCPGLPRAALRRAGTPQLTPITNDRLRRRLSLVSSVREQIERELVTHEVARQPDGSARDMYTVRVNFHCNQSCAFCFVSTHLPPADDDAVKHAIRTSAAGGAVIALSGGEPTLNPQLVEYVKLAKAAGASFVELQTNATRLEDQTLVSALEQAGVDVAFISLHGSRAEISDAVTDAPGTFEHTVLGVDRVYRSGIELRLNFVFCRANYRDFPDYVRMVAARWPGARVTISFVAMSTDVVPRTNELVPRYSDVLPSMTEGVRLAEELGLRLSGFESMCGMPLCLIPEVLEQYLGLAAITAGIDGGEFVKSTPCNACALADRCYGLRRGYAELYGDAELRPQPPSASP